MNKTPSFADSMRLLREKIDNTRAERLAFLRANRAECQKLLSSSAARRHMLRSDRSTASTQLKSELESFSISNRRNATVYLRTIRADRLNRSAKLSRTISKTLYAIEDDVDELKRKVKRSMDSIAKDRMQGGSSFRQVKLIAAPRSADVTNLSPALPTSYRRLSRPDSIQVTGS